MGAPKYSTFIIRKEEIDKMDEFCKKRGDRARWNISRAVCAALHDTALFEEIDKEETINYKEIPKSETVYVCVHLEKEVINAFHDLAFKHRETVVAWVRKYVRYMNRAFEVEQAKQAAEQTKEKERVASKIWKM